jgi:hypothetical protein
MSPSAADVGELIASTRASESNTAKHETELVARQQLRDHKSLAKVSRAFAVAGAGFEQTSATAFRFVEIRPFG